MGLDLVLINKNNVGFMPECFALEIELNKSFVLILF